MTETLTESGTFAIDAESRTLRGILLPWGEKSRPSVSNTEPIYFERGSVALPRDPAVVTLNRGHDRFDPVGRATTLEDRPEGIYAEFALADTDEADAYLADPSKLRKLSAEVTGIVRDAADRARGIAAKLTGGALVTEGAFASAALFAIGDETEAEVPDTAEALTPDDNGDIAIAATDTPETVTVTAGENETVFVPEADETESESAMADAKAPETLTASAVNADTPQADINALFDAITKNVKFGDNTDLQALDKADKQSGLFAFNDIKISGAGAVGTGVVQPQYIGEVWSGRTQQRKVIPLISSGTLTSLEVKGWRWLQKPQVGTWAGNKTDVPTNTPTTQAYTLPVQRFAGGHDIAREFIDFGVTEVLDGYTRAMADSYALQSDNYALQQLLAGATSAEVGTLPAGVGLAVGKIVEGALRVINANAVPSFAIVATDVYRELAFTKKDDVLAFLSMSLGLEEGALATFKIVPHTGMAAGTVLVGAKEAAKAHELGGSPIRVDALDLARGGYDEAIFGYIAVGVEYAGGLQLVTPDVP